MQNNKPIEQQVNELFESEEGDRKRRELEKKYRKIKSEKKVHSGTWAEVRESMVGLLYVVFGWTLVTTISYFNTEIDQTTPWYLKTLFYMLAAIVCYRIGKLFLYRFIKDK